MVGGGPEEQPHLLDVGTLLSSSTVIAADGGWRLCQVLGTKAALVIGDMDTLTPAEVREAASQGAEVLRFPSDKDQSDLELALLAAHRMGAGRITILGSLGGQWDHCLANLLAPLSLCQSLGVPARLLTLGAEIYLLDSGQYSLRDQAGVRVSFAALSVEVGGLSLRGFLFPLENGSLWRHQTLGLANGVVAPEAQIEVATGEVLLTLVRPASKREAGP